MFFDAASFFVSAGSLAAIRKREALPEQSQRESVLSQIREGLQIVLGDRRLRRIAACTGWSNFFSSAVFSALFFLFLKELGFNAFSLGILFGVSSIGGILGAVVSGRIAKRIGVGPAIILGGVLFGIPTLPMAFVTPEIALPALVAMLGASFFGNLLYNINQVSFRQAIVPVRLQGRLNATMRTIVWGTIPLGAFIGGPPRRGDRSPIRNLHRSRRGRVCVPLGSLLARPADPRNARIRGLRDLPKPTPSRRRSSLLGYIAMKAPTPARAPRATRRTPITRENRVVRTPSFSANITTERPPIQRRLIDPEMKRTSMKSQQHPMQYRECRKPMRIAPIRPDRQ